MEPYNQQDLVPRALSRVSLPVDFGITFTRQVQKKNKIFSDGRMLIDDQMRIKVLDSFNQYVGSCDLVAQPPKLELFEKQYVRAVVDSQGLLQGVIDGLIVCLDNPPNLECLRISFQEWIPPNPKPSRSRAFVPASQLICSKYIKTEQY